MSNFTCKGCGSRYPGCHAKCEKYQAEKAAWEEKKAEIRKRQDIERRLNDHEASSIARNKKRMGKQRPYKFGGQ